MFKKILVAFVFLLIGNLSYGAICEESTSSDECMLIQASINIRFVPNESNNYSRFRSALAMDAYALSISDVSKKYLDNSALAWGEGQLYLAVHKDLRKEVFNTRPENVRVWLKDNANPVMYEKLKMEISVFNQLPSEYKVKWMMMRPESRLAALSIDRDLLFSFIKNASPEINYNAKKVSLKELIDSRNLFK